MSGPYREPGVVVRRPDVPMDDRPDPSALSPMDWFCAVQSAIYLIAAALGLLLMFFRAMIAAAVALAELFGG